MDLSSIVQYERNPAIPDFRPGDTVRVYSRVVEGERERVQAFEGVVIRMRRRGIASTFTVRRVSHGVGVERTFPLYSPLIERVEVVRVGHVRRAKLYYLRERIGKRARVKAGSRARFEELMAAQERARLQARQAAPEAAEEAEEEAEAVGEAEEAVEAEAAAEEPEETAAEEEPEEEPAAEEEGQAEEEEERESG